MWPFRALQSAKEGYITFHALVFIFRRKPGLLFKFGTITPEHLIVLGGWGGAHKRVRLAFGREMCLALYTGGQTQKTLKAHSAVNMWQTECLEREWILPYLSSYSCQAVLMLSRGVIGHNACVEQAVGEDGTKRIKEQMRSGVRDPLSWAIWALDCFPLSCFLPQRNSCS